MYCAGCGKEMPTDARFCPSCGRAAAPAAAWNYTAAMPHLDGLVRPREGRKLGGVCAAFSVRYGWDISLTRLLTVLAVLFTFPFGLVAYFVLWAVLPEAPHLLPAQASQYGGSTGV